MLDLTNEEMDLMPDMLIENINFWQDARSDTMERMIRGENQEVAYKDFLDQTIRLRKLESIFLKVYDNI